MRVIAQRGCTVLVALNEPSDKLFDQTLGVVVDTRRATVSRPAFVQSILARGYWTPFEGEKEPVLSHVRAAIEGGLLTSEQLNQQGRGRQGRGKTIDQLSPEFVAAYAQWLGVTEGEADRLLREEPLVEVTNEHVPDAGTRLTGLDKPISRADAAE